MKIILRYEEVRTVEVTKTLTIDVDDSGTLKIVKEIQAAKDDVLYAPNEVEVFEELAYEYSEIATVDIEETVLFDSEQNEQSIEILISGVPFKLK